MGTFVNQSLRFVIASVHCFWLVVVSGTPQAKADDFELVATESRFLLAIPEFAASNPTLAGVANRIWYIVKERLAGLENYAVIDTSDAIAYTKFPGAPDFSVWQSRHIRFLLLGQNSIREKGKLMLEERVFDVPEHTVLTGQQVYFLPDDWREAANYLADAIVVELDHPDSAPNN